MVASETGGVERVGDQDYSQGRVAVLAMDAEDFDAPEGSQHDLFIEVFRERSRRTKNRTAVDPIEFDFESVIDVRT